MGISSTGRQVAVVAASAAWLTVAGPAAATADEPGSDRQLTAETGVCGWFSEQFADRFEAVTVCGYDGVGAADGQREPLNGPLVVVDRYACFFHGDGGCVGDHHEAVIDRDEFVVDPLLRQARITAAFTGCGLEVEFVGLSEATPHGSLSAYHGIAGGPSVGVYADQALSRPAQWWGKVCGPLVVAEAGEAHMWRMVAAVVPASIAGLEGGGGGGVGGEERFD